MTYQVLAATFTVVFRGLLMFHGDTATTKERVISVAAPSHRPRISVGGQTRNLRKGDTVLFNLPAGPATTDASFNSRVPNLRDYIISGAFPGDVAAGAQNTSRILVVLPQGTLSGEGKFETPARFTKSDASTEIRCMAEQVLLRSDTSSDVTITIVGPERTEPEIITVPAGGLVTIANTPGMGAGLHFHEYERLLEADGRLGAVSLVTDQTCKDDGTFAAATKAEKATRAKGRPRDAVFGLPNGDCGPVDNP